MILEKLEGRVQIGMATMPDGAKLSAEFLLDGRKTWVRVHAPDPRIYFGSDLELLAVSMTNGTHLTFVSNVKTSAEMSPRAGTITYLPEFALMGRRALETADLFKWIGFTTDDIRTICYDFDAFATLLDPGPHIDALIASQEKRIERSIPRGERPIITYFTGKSEIVVADTPMGRVSVNHRPTFGMGGPKGTKIENEIRVELEIQVPCDVDGAIEHLRPLLRFLQLIGGRKQRVSNILALLDGEERPPFEILWCLSWSREDEDENEPSPADLPINGGPDAEKFGQILTRWMDLDEERRDARIRFAGAFAKGNRFDTDRLIAAANMFDILPSSCFSKPEPLPDDIVRVRDDARTAFGKLEQSEHRDSALGALGRLGKMTLKEKVRQRASMLQMLQMRRFQSLDLLLGKAIDSRNHFVHGSEESIAKIDFYYDWMTFHCRALEFVFAASDLADAGWDAGNWKPGSTSHPMATFRIIYNDELKEYLGAYAALWPSRARS